MNAPTHDAPMGVWQNGTMPQSVLTMRGSGGDPIVVTCATSSDHLLTPQGNSAGSSSLTCSSKRGPLCHAVPPHATLTCSRTQVATLGMHWIMLPPLLSSLCLRSCSASFDWQDYSSHFRIRSLEEEATR